MRQRHGLVAARKGLLRVAQVPQGDCQVAPAQKGTFRHRIAAHRTVPFVVTQDQHRFVVCPGLRPAAEMLQRQAQIKAGIDDQPVIVRTGCQRELALRQRMCRRRVSLQQCSAQ